MTNWNACGTVEAESFDAWARADLDALDDQVEQALTWPTSAG